MGGPTCKGIVHGCGYPMPGILRLAIIKVCQLFKIIGSGPIHIDKVTL